MYDIYKPKSSILSQYISEFTILKKEGFRAINYIAFPHSVSAVAFFSGATINYNTSGIQIEKSDKEGTSVVALGKYLHPIHLSYQNAVNEIAINFKPTGINYFFDENYNKIAHLPFQIVNSNSWNTFSTKLFEIPITERIDAIESFLLSQLRSKNLIIIEQIIDWINQDLSIKVNDIAIKANVSERTVNRLFHTYLGCSPTIFKKIVQFRSSVLMNNTEMNLTELCLTNDYYDSPHFTRAFKKLTSKNPRDFFKALSFVKKNKFPYIFK